MKNQMKRLSAPKTWPIKRKIRQWIAKPLPGAHTLEYSLALAVIVRDFLNLAENSAEARKIIRNKDILVNNKSVKEVNYNVGLYDVVSVPKLKQNYRIILTKNQKLAIQLIADKESALLPLQVRGKQLMRKGVQQINFANGWNLLNKSEYAVRDTVLFDLNEQKITKHISFKAGCSVIALAGKHTGQIGTLQSIKLEGALKKQKIASVKTGNEEWSTSVDNLFVIGDKTPEFTAEIK